MISNRSDPRPISSLVTLCRKTSTLDGVHQSTTILSSVGCGTDNEGDSVVIGGSAMCPTARGWGGSWPVTADVPGYVETVEWAISQTC